jgi:competence protein ComGC
MLPYHAARGDISMKNIWVVLLLLSSLLLAQESNPSATSQPKSKDAKGQVTVQGCVGKFSGDYTLTKQDPAITYELQATGKTKLRHYLGQRVEVTGTEAPSMSTSSDALNKTGSASPVTITITSIKTISQECTVHQVADK